MTAAILTAAGHRALAAGNVGTPAIDAVVADPPLDVIVVELSSFQLHWSSTITCAAAAILNLAEDHLDWHGDFAHYVADKLTIWAGGLMVANRDDPEVAKRLVGRSGRVVAVTSGPPQPGEIGVVDGQLLDRAFAAGEVLAAVDDIRPAGPHQVTNALVAAALARSHGVAAAAVHAGLTGYRPDRHRGDVIAEIGRVRYVDDSKATNPHAALASLSAYPRVVWIAGGLLKGADLGPTVQAAADRLVAAVVIGRDRRPVLDALARHAPGVTVVEVHSADTGAMDEAVRAAARLASAGDTVLLAPAAASMDLFRDYAHRGDAFAAAVQRLRSS
jgi:UDP-N-acetylmuramoylalanine--D-glutamate ligase